MYGNQTAGQGLGGVALVKADAEAPTHIVKYRAFNHGAEKAPAAGMIEERVFNCAEDAEAYATSLVVGGGAHPESIHIYAETGVRVTVGINYNPTTPATAGPRAATQR